MKREQLFIEAHKELVEDFKDRRRYEWRGNWIIWSAVAGFTALWLNYFPNEIPNPSVLRAAYIVLFALYWIFWVAPIYRSNRFDKLKADFYLKSLLVSIGGVPTDWAPRLLHYPSKKNADQHEQWIKTELDSHAPGDFWRVWRVLFTAKDWGVQFHLLTMGVVLFASYYLLSASN